MFLKVFRVKSSTAIRGSDRRKLRSEVSNAFTRLSQEEISEIVPNKEEMTVTRILTHSGQNVVVYCLNGEPVFFEVEKKIIPTVYTLWKFPDMLPSFTTWPPVFDKLKGGADLMLPGVIIPPAGITTFGSFDKGTVCSVCLNGNRAPVAVGTTLVSSRDLLEDGMRGKGVMVLHVYLDLLWAHGSKTLLPQLDVMDFQAESEEQNEPEHDDTDEKEGKSPNNLVPEESLVDDTAKLTIAEEGDLSARQNELENAVGASSVKSDFKDEADGEQNDKFHSTPGETNLAEEKDTLGTNVESQELQEGDDAMSRGSPFENMDDLLEYCFFCALLRMKKVELPVLTSTFFRTYLLPSCPDGSSVDIKKSSYKKLSKFLQCMQEKLVITVQEASKGVDQISAIAWHHPELKSFKSVRPAVECAAAPQSDPAPSGLNPHPPVIEELLSVSAALLPIFSEFGVRKGAVLTHSDVRSTMTNYVKSHELVSSGNKRMVVLDPTLTRILIKKNEYIELLAWDELFERVSGKMNKCHQITIHGQQPVLRKGKIDAIEIKVEQRMGNKKVTLIRKLDSYGIDPQDFAHNVQIKAACSTSVTQLPGKAPTPGMQVLVQGNQVAIVAKCLLDEYKIPKKYITGLDLLKSSKKKKGEK